MLMALQAPSRKSSVRAKLWLPATALIVLAAMWGWYSHTYRAAVARPAVPAPVHVAVVERKDFPIVLTGLGTVQPANTVTVRSRVDGQIETVAFEEGQIVKQGDLLVQIDPAPFKATLDQAKAKLAQDQVDAEQQQAGPAAHRDACEAGRRDAAAPGSAHRGSGEHDGAGAGGRGGH